MKAFILIFSILSTLSFASDSQNTYEEFTVQNAERSLVLVNKEYEVQTDKIEIIRTSNTPKKVKITMRIPLWDEVKLKLKNYTYKYNSRICKDQTNALAMAGADCEKKTECVSKNAHGKCLRTQTTTYCTRHININQCSTPQKKMSFMCQGSRTKKVTINFKRLPQLQEGEKEVFVLRGFQKAKGKRKVRFALSNKSTKQNYRVKSRSFLGRKNIKVLPQNKRGLKLFSKKNKKQEMSNQETIKIEME
jgi:hypothetical protein